jgi:hypothetical protein
MTETSKHIAEKRFSDGTVVVPAGTFVDATFIPRLTLRSTPESPLDWSRVLSELGKQIDDGVMVFADTNLFHAATDERLWRIFSQHPTSLTLTPRVRNELEPWLNGKETHPAARLVRDILPPWALGRSDPRTTGAYNYYMNLLAMRKLLITIEVELFEQEHGRKPSEDERVGLLRSLHESYGPRPYRLAKKSEGKSENVTEEEVVYLAFEHALRTGTQTVVITRDADLQEQFYKLQYLIEMHYRSYLMAEDFFAIHRHTNMSARRRLRSRVYLSALAAWSWCASLRTKTRFCQMNFSLCTCRVCSYEPRLAK